MEVHGDTGEEDIGIKASEPVLAAAPAVADAPAAEPEAAAE